mgnify:CR=1 FL=1
MTNEHVVNGADHVKVILESGQQLEGTVIAAGDGRVSDSGKVTPLTVKVGDRGVFGKYSGTEIKVDGEDRLIVSEEDILGIVE